MAYIEKIWKDYPDTTTPILAQDMNDIKGAINQIGSFIPLTAEANADYYSTFKGTLATGDIFYGYFPLVTNGSSNAKLSVNGSGGTYINLIYFDGTQVLGNEVSLKYKSMYYDGTNFVLLDESYNRSNANGSWIRFNDGTMITWQEQTLATSVNTSWGSLYTSPIITVNNFPLSFYSVPKSVMTIVGGVSVWYINASENTVDKPMNIQLCRATAQVGSTTFKLDIIAVGRWKA